MAHRVTRLALARVKRGYSQKKLAEKAGVARRTVIRLEKGVDTPHLMTLHKLATALDVEIADLEEATP